MTSCICWPLSNGIYYFNIHIYNISYKHTSIINIYSMKATFKCMNIIFATYCYTLISFECTYTYHMLLPC